MLVAAGCGGASSDRGLGAMLQIDGAQFVPGPIPAGDDSGPKVVSVFNTRSFVRPGERNKPIEGAIDPGATGVAIGIEGDTGHWIIPAGPPDVQTPKLPSFRAGLTFSSEIPSGPFQLAVVAVDPEGHHGPPSKVMFTALALEAPEGIFVVSLAWDTNADLDLHVVDPSGVEIWARNLNSYAAEPGQPPDPEAIARGGVLDFDSNASCLIDGRRQENVIYKTAPPPPGRYIIRVDTFSLCGEGAARWRVEARRDGELVASAFGTSTESDTRNAHDLGAGVTALEVDQL